MANSPLELPTLPKLRDFYNSSAYRYHRERVLGQVKALLLGAVAGQDPNNAGQVGVLVGKLQQIDELMSEGFKENALKVLEEDLGKEQL